MTLERVLDAVVTTAAVIVISIALAVASGAVKAEPPNDNVLMDDVTATEFSQFVMDACKENGVVFLSTVSDDGIDYVLPLYCEWGEPYNPLEGRAPKPAEMDEYGMPKGTWL